jgi:hypothetical protein
VWILIGKAEFVCAQSVDNKYSSASLSTNQASCQIS